MNVELLYDARAAVRHLKKRDPRLGALIERVGPLRFKPPPFHSTFWSLASSIVYQQLSGKAAATILGRVVALFPSPHLRPEDIAQAADETLRSAGLSGNKTAALKDLAAKALGGQLPTLEELREMEEEAIIERLTAVRGVGRWTAEMLLLKLGRPDVLSLGDLGLRKGFALAFKQRALPSSAQLAKRGELWRPYRSVASWYLWRATELAP